MYHVYFFNNDNGDDVDVFYVLDFPVIMIVITEVIQDKLQMRDITEI